MTQVLIDRATLEQLVVALEEVSDYINRYAVPAHQLELDPIDEAITAGRAALAQQELPQKERPDFMAGYDAGMADAKRMAQQREQQGEPVAQARLGMKDGLAMALSVVELYGMKGDVIYREIAKLRDGIAAAPAPQSQEPAEWRTEAVKWIRRKAEDQRATNEQNPRHAEAYPSWGERVRQWHGLADELELEQNSTSFGLEPYQEPAPQAQPICKLFGTLPVYDTPAPQEKAREE